jgi:hypothetical protein
MIGRAVAVADTFGRPLLQILRRTMSVKKILLVLGAVLSIGLAACGPSPSSSPTFHTTAPTFAPTTTPSLMPSTLPSSMPSTLPSGSAMPTSSPS